MLKEKLASHIHTQWSAWMKYLFSKGTFNDDGTWTMPAWAVKRWNRQMNSDYEILSEKEQKADRKEAKDILDVLDVSICPECDEIVPRYATWEVAGEYLCEECYRIDCKNTLG